MRYHVRDDAARVGVVDPFFIAFGVEASLPGVLGVP
jgi:hypothetical protein